MENKLIFIDEIIDLIKQKKELSTLDNNFIHQVICSEPYVVPAKYISFTMFKKSKLCKDIVSSTRKKLRDVYGLFLDVPLTQKHIDRLVSTDTISLLAFHKSTQERTIYYASIYALIFDVLDGLGLKKDYNLADIACGYNPLAYDFLPRKPVHYFAYDLSSQDMSSLQYFFNKFSISGSAQAFDALSTRFYEEIASKNFDVTFLFKALDPLESVQRHSSKKLLSALQSSFFVVSFSLFSIGGKVPIPMSKRSWFDKFLVKQGWEFKTLQIPNEIFYIIKK